MDEETTGQAGESEPIKTIASEPVKTATAEHEPTQASARDLLLEIELDATLQFGSREMPLKDVLALGPGDVLELNRHISEPVDLVVGDRIMARGEVVILSGNFALLITQVAEPQLRLESIRSLI